MIAFGWLCYIFDDVGWLVWTSVTAVPVDAQWSWCLPCTLPQANSKDTKSPNDECKVSARKTVNVRSRRSYLRLNRTDWLVISNQEIGKISVSVLKLPLRHQLRAMHKLFLLCCLKSVFLVYFTEVTFQSAAVASSQWTRDAEEGSSQGRGQDDQPCSLCVNCPAAGFLFSFIGAPLPTSDPNILKLKETLLWASLNFVHDPSRKMENFAIEEGCVLAGASKHASLH